MAVMAVQTYHTAADRLRLIPASAKRAAGIQYEISLDRSGATASELINIDLRVSHPSCMHSQTLLLLRAQSLLFCPFNAAKLQKGIILCAELKVFGQCGYMILHWLCSVSPDECGA